MSHERKYHNCFKDGKWLWRKVKNVICHFYILFTGTDSQIFWWGKYGVFFGVCEKVFYEQSRFSYFICRVLAVYKGWLGFELNIDSFKTHCYFCLKLLHIIFLKGQIKHGGNSYHLKASHVLDTMLHIL